MRVTYSNNLDSLTSASLTASSSITGYPKGLQLLFRLVQFGQLFKEKI